MEISGLYVRCVVEMCGLYEVCGGDMWPVGDAWRRCVVCMRCIVDICSLYEGVVDKYCLYVARVSCVVEMTVWPA